MTIEQRLDQLEKRNKRLTAALAVAICEADRRLVGADGTSIGL